MSTRHRGLAKRIKANDISHFRPDENVKGVLCVFYYKLYVLLIQYVLVDIFFLFKEILLSCKLRPPCTLKE